ncbi:MAG: NAD-dependent epimerase/dehydratase family protein [Verrucomicrobiota bacterium]|jgi:UDP-glucose 4-epimerase
MKALVTGGAGFIGSHLAEALCRRGANVVVLDDLSSGDLRNLAWRQPGEALEFVQGDAGDEVLLRKLAPGCDWIFHESAIASVPLSVAKPRESHRANLEATLTLLLAAREAGVRRFVFASSSAIYGDSDAAVKHESHPPNPLTPYGLQKFASERYVRMFHEFYELPTVSLRYFNVFGPRQAFDSPYSGVIAKFCTGLLAGQAPTIFGDGLQSRDFIYVANVVAANLLAVEQPAEQVAGRVFNIGAGASLNLRQLLAELNQLTGRNVAPVFAPARPGDVRFSEADISAARADLGYAVQVSWREGLRRTLDFYRP